jgi:hypothetical protein
MLMRCYLNFHRRVLARCKWIESRHFGGLMPPAYCKDLKKIGSVYSELTGSETPVGMQFRLGCLQPVGFRWDTIFAQPETSAFDPKRTFAFEDARFKSSAIALADLANSPPGTVVLCSRRG